MLPCEEASPGGGMADAADLKSAAPKGACRFESGPGHHTLHGKSQPQKSHAAATEHPAAGRRHGADTRHRLETERAYLRRAAGARPSRLRPLVLERIHRF